MIVDKYGRVAGSIDLAALAEMYADTDDADLRDHYRTVAAEHGVDLAADTASEPEPVEETGPEPESAGRPSQADNKAAWVDFAVSQGLDRDEAEASTKAELIDWYGSD